MAKNMMDEIAVGGPSNMDLLSHSIYSALLLLRDENVPEGTRVSVAATLLDGAKGDLVRADLWPWEEK